MSTAFYLSEHDLQDIIVGCWTDPEFRKAFAADPRKALTEWGIDLPADIDLRVAEDTEFVRHIVIPLAPDSTELNVQALGSPRADACVMSVCRPCACYKDRGTVV